VIRRVPAEPVLAVARGALATRVEDRATLVAIARGLVGGLGFEIPRSPELTEVSAAWRLWRKPAEKRQLRHAAGGRAPWPAGICPKTTETRRVRLNISRPHRAVTPLTRRVSVYDFNVGRARFLPGRKDGGASSRTGRKKLPSRDAALETQARRPPSRHRHQRGSTDLLRGRLLHSEER
jgi:hypothetical protein